MSENEYKELIDFLGKNFEKIDERFEKIDERFKKIDEQFEDARRHTGVLIEAVEHKIDIVIETVMGLNERLDRHTAENKQEHARLENRTLVNTADIATLDQRVGRLEEKV